ncbi:MAG: flagellar hook protein FlgE [Phycisphaerae bacterium]
MGLTTAMYTGLTGMSVNQTRIATIGNNIANVNTTAFKSSRTLFQTQMSQLLSAGSAPSATLGGTNPQQLGFGASIGSTQKNMTAGSVETTGVPSDAAIQGSGFFVVQSPAGRTAYTRDGAFYLDSANRLTYDGYTVRGFGVDASNNILPNALTDLSIPLGTQTIARATENVQIDGDLSSDGTIATQGNQLTSQPMVDGGGGAASAGTALTDVHSSTNPGTPLFAAGNTITVSGATRGGRVLPPQSFVVGTTGNTLGDYATWLQGALGIDTTAGVPGTPGVTVAGGTLVINSNASNESEYEISTSDILSDNLGVSSPFTFTETQEANGSGVFTSFNVYDSLGAPVTVNATFALDSTPTTGPVWRYYLDTTRPDGSLQNLGTGTVTFDNNGNYVSVAGNQFSIDRSGTGATSPLGFTLDLSQVDGLSTQLSAVVMSDQDGFPPGTLNNFSIGADGTINGSFTNGLTRVLGQLAIAVFPNDEGMVAEADNLYSAGPNSGAALITPPGTFGAGTIISGALETSNVDLAREFIGLIQSSTGFQAASRIISTSSDMLEQLLLIAR